MKTGLLKKNMSGFTLVEMIITIAIMGILATIAIISMTGGRAAARVEAAQKEVESEIALAKTYALQGKTQNNSGTLKTPCGYGVYFSSETSYNIYYKFADNCEEANKSSEDENRQHAGATDLPAKTLSGGITASDADGTGIYFTVPNANVYDETGAALTADKTIFLDAEGGGITKSVAVNKFGQITIGK